MAVRSTMGPVILAVRDLIGDPSTFPATGAFVWSDQQIQDTLDREARTDIILGEFHGLAGRYTLPGAPPSFAWTDYFDPLGWGDWETDATLYSGSMTLLTPTTSDYVVGHWTFAAPGQPPPVYIMGKTYDIYGAGRSIALRWAGKTALEFDFSAMRGTSFTRSQKQKQLLTLADYLATEMRVRSAKLVRRDVNGLNAY